jgi:hypothetical protein
MEVNMPLPNNQIIFAFFSSYFQIRHENPWGMVDADELELPTDPKALAKIEISVNLINQLRSASTMQDWINLIYELAAKEHSEDEHYSGKQYFGLASLFVDRPLLQNTLQAARSYIISQLNDEAEFKEAKTQLINELVEQKGRIAYETEKKTSTKESLIKMESMCKSIDAKLAAMEPINYHPVFFNEVISRRDYTAKVAKLHEESFDDFEKHVISGERTLSMLDKVCAAWEKKQRAAAPKPQAQPEPVIDVEVHKPVQATPVFDDSLFDFPTLGAASGPTVAKNPSSTFSRGGKRQSRKPVVKQQTGSDSRSEYKQPQKSPSGYKQY